MAKTFGVQIQKQGRVLELRCPNKLRASDLKPNTFHKEKSSDLLGSNTLKIPQTPEEPKVCLTNTQISDLGGPNTNTLPKVSDVRHPNIINKTILRHPTPTTPKLPPLIYLNPYRIPRLSGILTPPNDWYWDPRLRGSKHLQDSQTSTTILKQTNKRLASSTFGSLLNWGVKPFWKVQSGVGGKIPRNRKPTKKSTHKQ